MFGLHVDVAIGTKLYFTPLTVEFYRQDSNIISLDLSFLFSCRFQRNLWALA
jgi:hypothetical protein